MDKLFSADSSLIRGLTTVADVMILNLLFVATSLPLVTLGASLTALNFTAMRIGTGECVSVSGDYFRSFRQNFRQATIIGLLLAVGATVLGAWYIVLTTFALGAGAQFLLLAVWYVLAFGFATAAVFVFPYLARFEGSTRDVLRNAWLMSWKHPLTSLLAVVDAALCVAVTAFYPQAAGYGLFWLAIGFGGIAVINGLFFARVLARYTAPGEK